MQQANKLASSRIRVALYLPSQKLPVHSSSLLAIRAIRLGQRPHKPRDIRQASPHFRDSFRIARQGINIAGRRIPELFIDPFAWVKLQPTQGLLVYRTRWPRYRAAIAGRRRAGDWKDGIGQAIDAEKRGHLFEPRTDPLSAVEVVLAGHIIDTGQEGSAHASLNAVHDADFVGIEISARLALGIARLSFAPIYRPPHPCQDKKVGGTVWGLVGKKKGRLLNGKRPLFTVKAGPDPVGGVSVCCTVDSVVLTPLRSRCILGFSNLDIHIEIF